jgi:hypothetical protein
MLFTMITQTNPINMPRTATNTQNQSQSQNQEAKYDIINPDSWDITKHTCGAAKPNKSGQGKSAPFSYDGNRFYLKTPKMYCPFGASRPKPQPGKPEPLVPSWSLQMTFTDEAQSQVFQEKALAFDEFMIDEATKPENCVGWLGAPKTKLFSREVVESKYSRMVKYSKSKDGEVNTQYPPFVRAQFPTTFKEPYELTCEIFDNVGKLMDASPNPLASNCVTKSIPPGSSCSALLQGSIWCTASGYGVTWKLAQVKVFPPKGLPKGKCLVDDPEEDEKETTDSSTKPESSSMLNDPEDTEVEVEVEVEEDTTPVQPQSKTPASKPVLKRT